MGYAIDRKRDTAREVRRAATERLDHALAALDGYPARHEALHDARKDIKKLRGLLRLVRPVFPGYARENAALREAARAISALRDDTAMLETLDRLTASGALDAATAAPIRDRLERLRDDHAGATDTARVVADSRAALAVVRERVPGWTLTETGFKALAPGLAGTLKKARRDMRAARETGDPATFHDWRKRVKYHWYQAVLLKGIRPDRMRPRIKRAKELAELLGDHHDLVAFRARLATLDLPEEPRQHADRATAKQIARLEKRALKLGPELLSERPEALVRRWKRWWKAA